MNKMFLFVLLSLSLNALSADCLKTRASLDIGSGTTKLKVAKVNLCEKKIIEMLFERDVQVSYKKDLGKNPDKFLSDKIMEDGVKVLSLLKDQALSYGAEEIIAVATAGFREARNAQVMVDKIQKEISLSVRVISQQEEAQIGFLAGLSLTKKSKNKVVVWDIGGGSMQITALDSESKMMSFEGELASISFKDFIIGQFRELGVKSPNPFTAYEVVFSLAVARNHATRYVPNEIKQKITEPGVEVIGIGGVHSSSLGDHFPQKTSYTYGEVNRILSDTYRLSDDQIFSKYKDSAISNLILVLGYMQALHIKSVTFGNVNLGEGLLIK